MQYLVTNKQERRKKKNTHLCRVSFNREKSARLTLPLRSSSILLPYSPYSPKPYLPRSPRPSSASPETTIYHPIGDSIPSQIRQETQSDPAAHQSPLFRPPHCLQPASRLRRHQGRRHQATHQAPEDRRRSGRAPQRPSLCPGCR